jgi:hypothetical protein
MSADEGVFDCDFDLGHMAGDALTAFTTFNMVRVFTYCALQPGRIVFCMATQAQCITWRPQVRHFVRMNLMAVEAT